ncbi:PAS domain S-box protein [Acidobacteria bacterium AH-259-D05]|nr:PAS domain S-box protein [Acidobacteria bacterium AH-259-D05]
MSIPLRVLLVKEESKDSELITKELEGAGFAPDIKTVKIERDYFAQLDAEHDLIISEYALLQFDALRALQILKEKNLDIPFIIIGGKLGEELAVECMKQGAADFVLKSRLNRLGQAVKRILQEAKIRKEQHQSEASLREDIDRYRQIMDFAPDGIALIRDNKVAFVNRAGSRLLGAASPKQLIDKNFSEFAHPDSQKTVAEEIQKSVAEPASTTVLQEKFVRLDGKEISLNLEAASFSDNNNQGTLVVFREATPQDQEQQLFFFHDQLLSQVPDAVVAINTEKRVSYWNKSAQQIYGLTSEQCLGQRLDEVFQQRWLEGEDEKAFDQALASTGVWQGENVHVKNNGEEIGVRSSVSVLKDEQGQSTGLIFVIRDITKHKQSEERLKRERNFYSSALAAAAALVLVLDKEGRIILFNRACEQAAGYSFNEVRAKYPWEFLLSPEDSQSVQAFFQELTTNQFPHQYEGHWITKDGHSRFISWSDTAITDDSGSVTHVISTGIDLTDRKEAEQAAKDSQDYFRSLVENSVDLLTILDKNETIRFSTPSVEEILGWKPDEFTNKSFLEQVHEEDAPALRNILEEVKQKPGSTAPVEFRLQNKEGSWLNFEGVSKNLLQDSAVSGIAFTLRDNSKRRRAKEGIQRQFDSLNVIHAIDVATNSSLDLQVTIKVILEQITTQLKVDAACVLLFNPNTRVLKHFAGRGFRSIAVTRSQVGLGEGVAGRAALEHQLIRIPNLSDSGESSNRDELLSEEEFVAHYAVPLVARGELKGVLELFNRSAVTPDPNWSDFLTTVASQTAIAIDNTELVSKLQRDNTEIGFAYDITLEKVSEALDLREHIAQGHSRRVAESTVRLGGALGIEESDLAHTRRGALLHDLGKIRIPENILLKEGSLTDEEWELMRQHPGYAHQLISQIPYLRKAVNIPYCHHEKWDGSGYPRGLKGEEIPLEARVFAVVEAWDVLGIDRPYREAWPKTKIHKHLNAQSGTDFDPQVVKKFLELEKQGELSPATASD